MRCSGVRSVTELGFLGMRRALKRSRLCWPTIVRFLRVITCDARTGLCPLGHGILIRARANTEPTFYLERCPHCHGIWFDNGEWNVLAEGHLLEHLEDLWDPAKKGRIPSKNSMSTKTVEVRVERKPPEEELRVRAKERLGVHMVEQLEVLGNLLRRRSVETRREALEFLQAILPRD